VFIGIYFGALGFYWSYVETRTSLTFLFDRYSSDVSVDVLLAIRSAPWLPGSAPIPEDAEILRLDERDLSTAPLLEARAAAETRAGNYNQALRFYQMALTHDPGNPGLEARIGHLLARVGQTDQADALVDRLKGAAANNPAQQSELETSKVYNAL